MIMARARNVEHGMNKNCPLTKMDLEMGFLKLIIYANDMAWYDAPNAIYCKQRNKERDYTTGIYGHRIATTKERKGKNSTMCNIVRGYVQNAPSTR